MADLVMTIDSDSDVEVKKNKSKEAKNSKKPAKTANKDVEEEILLAHSVILQDTEEGPGKARKHTSGHIVGSNNLWNFSESLHLDQHRRMAMAEDLENETTNADEKAPFLQTTEDRV